MSMNYCGNFLNLVYIDINFHIMKNTLDNRTFFFYTLSVMKVSAHD
jgi:hypothetical protein